MPSPFVMTLSLTVIVFFVAIFLGEAKPIDVMSYWYTGFWELLAFTMQMTLILVLGYVLASTPTVSRLITFIVNPIKSTAHAAAVVAFFTMAISLFNWGLGLVFGAILARKFAELAKEKKQDINYGLVGAAAYTGMLIWHGGLSGSAPLTVATENHFLSKTIGILPVSETIFSAGNGFVTLALLVVIPLFLFLLGRTLKTKPVSEDLVELNVLAHQSDSDENSLDTRPWLGTMLGLIILAYLLFVAAAEGRSLGFISLNFVNFVLLALGLVMHRSLSSYSNSFDKAIKSASGILLLFPFYAGIMGIMKYSGLTVMLSQQIAEVSTATSFPFFAFVSSALVNVFVPSGGGQWVVQGPILIGAAVEHQFSISQTVMAFSYGDEITNMLQPFWALPLLGITGLKAREILPFTLLIMLLAVPIFLCGIYLF
jgi:short-chain fatty acids transporter